MKFRTVLLVHMVVLVVVMLGATVGAIGIVLDRTARRSVADELLRSRRGLSELIDHRRELYAAQTDLIADEPKLRAVVITEGVDRATVADVAQELRRTLRCELFLVVDADRRVLANVGRPGQPGTRPESVITRALAGEAASAVWVDRGVAYLVHARPVQTESSVFGALVIGHAIDDDLAAELSRETGNVILITHAGQRIAASPLAGGSRLDAVGGAALARRSEALAAPADVELGDGRYLALATPFGEPENGLHVVLARSLEPALDGQRYLTRVVQTIALMALALVLAIAVLAARRLARPFDAIVAFTRRVADGHLEERIEERGVTEVRALAQSMNQMAARLDESRGRLVLADRMASVGTLAAGVAHEINNPLAYVIANLDMLARELRQLKELLPAHHLDEADAMMSDTREGVDRVRRIVRDLKMFSRADEDERGPVDLAKVIELSVNMTQHEIRMRAKLVKELGDVPPVEGNEARIGQVLVNLLVNAAQAMPPGAAGQNHIRVVTRRHDELRVCLEVSDTGTGIPPEIQRKIFDPFFTTKQIGVGTGLGLSICHSIVKNLGGDIEVESQVGKGTTFRVLLPIAKVVARVAPPPLAVEQRQRRARILVVDDEPMFANALKRALSSDHDVTAVTDGRTAVETLTGRPTFDVVLCDLMMPHMTGMDVYAELAERAPAVLDHLIFVTGGAFTPQARKFLDQVKNQRLEKPVDLTLLRRVIRDRLAG